MSSGNDPAIMELSEPSPIWKRLKRLRKANSFDLESTKENLDNLRPVEMQELEAPAFRDPLRDIGNFEYGCEAQKAEDNPIFKSFGMAKKSRKLGKTKPINAISEDMQEKDVEDVSLSGSDLKSESESGNSEWHQEVSEGICKSLEHFGEKPCSKDSLDVIEVDEDDEEEILKSIRKRMKASADAVIREIEAPKSDSMESVIPDAEKPKENKRRTKKDRTEMFAESQRLLRETKGVTFVSPSPPMVPQKSISGLLEKIRLRKLQVGMKTRNSDMLLLSSKNYPSSKEFPSQNAELPAVSLEDENKVEPCDSIMKEVEGPGTPDEPVEIISSNLAPKDCDAFRPPLEDTQDLFCNSQLSLGGDQDNDSNIQEGVFGSGQINLHLDTETQDEDFERHARQINLHLDTETQDEDYERSPNEDTDGRASSPRDQRQVMAFLDDEAEDEDDNGLVTKNNNHDEEEDENGDLQDLVGTVEERPIDNEKRNELHRKWLEQQDDALTDDLLVRLKTGWKPRGLRDNVSSFLDEDLTFEHLSTEDADLEIDPRVNGSLYEDPFVLDNEHRDTYKEAEGVKTKEINLCKEPRVDKETIEEGEFSDDEEVERKLLRQKLLEAAKEKEAFLSPSEDETSRDMLGLIKKVNVHVAKTKTLHGFLEARASATINQKICSSKSTFLKRATLSSSLSIHKQSSCGSGNSRSFIFGRDDSNSSHGLSGDEASRDASRLPKDTMSEKSKFGSGPPKLIGNMTASSEGSGPSLFEILKRQAANLEKGSSSPNNATKEMIASGISIFSRSLRASKMGKEL